jgi:hypothetical protein
MVMAAILFSPFKRRIWLFSLLCWTGICTKKNIFRTLYIEKSLLMDHSKTRQICHGSVLRIKMPGSIWNKPFEYRTSLEFKQSLYLQIYLFLRDENCPSRYFISPHSKLSVLNRWFSIGRNMEISTICCRWSLKYFQPYFLI